VAREAVEFSSGSWIGSLMRANAVRRAREPALKARMRERRGSDEFELPRYKSFRLSAVV